MKKFLFSLVVFWSLQATAQTYSISFSGTGLSTVKVQNLTTGRIVDVPAGDVLLLSTATGYSEVTDMNSSGLKLYPNPMTDKAAMEILPCSAGDAIISVWDMTGKVLIKYKGYLEKSTQEFSLSGLKNGLHLITVQGNGYQFYGKLLSCGKTPGMADIIKISNNIQEVAGEKSDMNTRRVQATVDMDYKKGEILKYTAVSGNRSTVMTDIPASDKTVTFTFTDCKDGDDNYYPVIQIGSQLWMAENLKTTKLNDNTTPIPNVSEGNDWEVLSTPGYCWHDNNSANRDVYGALYNWYTVNTGNLCPAGWHTPSDAEWTTFENYLIANGYNYNGTTTGNYLAKSLGSNYGWASSKTTGAVGNTDYSARRNSTGFTALPGGSRLFSAPFSLITYDICWWSSTEASPESAYYRSMHNYSSSVTRNYDDKRCGFSVRCLHD